MTRIDKRKTKRGTVLLMVVGLLAMLFMLVTAYITLARFDRLTAQYASRGQQIEQILGSVNDVVSQQIMRTSAGGAGAMVTGENYADIPGYREGRWMSSLEPVRDPGSPSVQRFPENYQYPGVTSLDPNDSGNKRLARSDPTNPDPGLMFDGNTDGVTVVRPDNPSGNPDTGFNARRPFMDADADGITDSSFPNVALVTEAANAVTGTTVRADNFNPAAISEANDPVGYRAWRQFDEQARYETAVRIVPHGGMVLAALPESTSWNRDFVYHMFNWMLHPTDSRDSLHLGNDPNDLALLENLWATSGAIEPVLRVRGGLLPSAGGSETLPPALRTLDQRFSMTFNWMRRETARRTDPWQRFNIADATEWNLWRGAMSLDPDAYNAGDGSVGPNPPLSKYASRRLITTVNNSDDLAREQSSSFRNYRDPNDLPGIDAGQLKFYLGRITDPTTGAFLADGTFHRARGPAIVRELAGYFHEMLADYKTFDAPMESPTENPDDDTLRRRQAFMLAVNTVAFAAPRSTAMPGRIDAVWCDDAANSRVYVGYAPQPFITQVMAYKKTDQMTNTDQIALAVELYNPNDPYWNGSNDDQALYMPQFAISLNDGYENGGAIRRLDGTNVQNVPTLWRLDGREFLKIYINDNGFNDYFSQHDPNMQRQPVIGNLSVSAVNREIRVKLWREALSSPGGGPMWVLVDELEIKEPADRPPDPSETGPGGNGQTPGGIGHDPPPGPAPEGWKGSWTDAWRDTRTESYWGLDPSHPDPARWRCTIVLPKTKPASWTTLTEFYYRDEDDGMPHEAIGNNGQPNRLLDLGAARPDPMDPNDPVQRWGPTSPLCTMNANGNGMQVELHGAPRPASFPTVGFMLFVPRFSHTVKYDGANVIDRKAAGEYLFQQWEKKLYTKDRADLGHMPIFDNNQHAGACAPPVFPDAPAGTGRVPWGLLVFDYFTTLNPAEVDPYRVPGRVNINMAPWYVLAGLPVIGPMSRTNLNLPIFTTAGGSFTNASPAFWSVSSGVLTGTGQDGTVRRPVAGVLNSDDAANGWYRLKPWLAQSVAAYRDRLQYVSADWPWPDAWKRNDTSAQYRSAIYGEIRGEGTGTTKLAYRGFLTLGELVNVMGFDSTMPSEWALGADHTALARGDFMKAVSLMALLDTHFLTTRSNTYTIYTTLTDRENPQSSLRSQVTIDRSKLLPKLVWTDLNTNGVPDSPDEYNVIQNSSGPEVIGQREVGYFNARYDD